MELKDFIPEKPTFTLSSKGKTYTLRIPNLEDKIEIIRICGGEDEFRKVFQSKNWSIICKVIYRLLVEKQDLLATKEKRITDEGIEEEVLVTGPILLLRAITSQVEAAQMVGAFMTAMVASEPLAKDLVETEVKKNQLEKSIGESSATSSPVSTDTPQTISEASPLAS